MTVKIHGKEYKTVAERLNEFHKDHKEGSVITEIIKELSGEKFVTMKAIIQIGSQTFTGHAHEVCSSSGINSTSAYENCETSAIGRALASAGYIGSEFASADEVANAIKGQEEQPGKDTDKSVSGTITVPQQKRLFAILKGSELPIDLFATWLKEQYSYEKTEEIKKGNEYEAIIKYIENYKKEDGDCPF